MLPSYLLSLREGIEAALIIGIVIGALRKIHRTDLAPALWWGVLSAAVVSILAAVLLTLFGLELEGSAEKIYEGATMLLAAGILTWMIFWMSQQARTLKAELEEGVSKAAASTGRRAIFWLAFVAVVREGVELALFLTASIFATDVLQTAIGAALGLGTAVLLGWSIFAAIVRLDLRRFFQATGILLILFAAGLVAHGVHEFNEVNLIPAVVEHVWDANAFLPAESILGQFMKALFGYNPTPALTEMIAYFGYMLTVALTLRGGRKKSEGTATQPQA
ncbi:MAG: FTR1 family protein [Chloroflexi bacterium]|nr:FTR1 family protein [Chloroflexota bacterium]